MAEKKEKNWIAIVAIIGLVITLIILSAGTIKKESSNEQQKELSVTGTGVITTEADQATAYITITVVNDTAQISQKQNSELMSKVIQALKDQGISETDIETVNFQLNPKDEWNETSQKTDLVGYEAINTIKAKTTDTKNIGKYLDAAINAGATNIESISFGLTKEKEKTINTQAIQKASAEAKEKAQQMAQNIGVKIGEITYISENNYGYEPYTYYSPSYGVNSAYDSKIATPILPSNIDVTANVDLTYEIEYKK